MIFLKCLYIERNGKLKRPWIFLLNSQGYNFNFNWDFQCTQPFTSYNAVVEMAPYDLFLNRRAVTLCKDLLRYGQNTFMKLYFFTMTYSNLKKFKISQILASYNNLRIWRDSEFAKFYLGHCKQIEMIMPKKVFSYFLQIFKCYDWFKIIKSIRSP